MATRKKRASFDPKAFLSRIGAGRTNVRCRANAIVFSQGDAADAVFYLQKGKVKITVLSTTGKEAVLAICSAPAIFSARDV